MRLKCIKDQEKKGEGFNVLMTKNKKLNGKYLSEMREEWKYILLLRAIRTEILKKIHAIFEIKKLISDLWN